MYQHFGIYLLGTDENDHTILVTLFTIAVIAGLLILRKIILDVITGKQNKKR